jgi:dUTP pyrophosphatase
MNEQADTAPLWVCDECKRDFKNQAGLISHLRSHKPTVAPAQSATDHISGESGPQSEVSADPVVPFNISDHAVKVSRVAAPVEASVVNINIKRLPSYHGLPDLKLATAGSAAFDLYAANDHDIIIGISDWELIPTGLCMEIPPGWWGLCAPRSGLAANDGITVLNTPGVIDSDYRGELKVNLVNNTTKKFVVKRGMRICQIMFQRSYPVSLNFVEELSETQRGTGGFGSTGR